jgi:GR25 family glycosyltransferase involved in LPS biosynthesis
MDLPITAYVINLKKREDRWNQFLQNWNSCQTIKFERYDAIEDTPGWKGLFQTHQKIISENINSPYILILEDDAMMLEDFDNRFKSVLTRLQTIEWKLFYGGYTFPDGLQYVEKDLIRGNFLTAHFIIIRNILYQEILSASCIQIDVFYRRYQGLASYPMLSIQQQGFSNIENQITDYNRYFNMANDKIEIFFQQEKKKNNYNWYHLFLPTDLVHFISFDLYDFKFPHAQKFIEIGKTIPANVKFDKLLSNIKPDWVFSDQYMLPHASQYAILVDCKLGAVVSDINLAPSNANIVVNSLTKQIHFRKDILTVITTFYKVKNWTDEENIIRQTEIETAILANLNNSLVKEVILLCEDQFPYAHQKLKVIMVKTQPLYDDLFQTANMIYGLVMITNSDIELTVKELTRIPSFEEIYALTRYEIDGTSPQIDNYHAFGSHDSFIFWAPLKLRGSSFLYPQNVWGSENLTINRLREMGYRIKNPCLTIKIIHHHRSELRNLDRYRIKSEGWQHVSPEY